MPNDKCNIHGGIKQGDIDQLDNQVKPDECNQW